MSGQHRPVQARDRIFGRTGADHQRSDLRPPLQRAEHLGVKRDALFAHQAAEEQHRHIVVGDASRMAPGHVAPRGREKIAVDAAAPQTGMIVAAQCLHLRDERGGGREDVIGAAIEAPQVRLGKRPQPAQAVVVEVGLEPCVHAGHERHPEHPREGFRAGAEDVGRRDMDDLRGEPPDVLAHLARQAGRETELATHGERNRRHRHQRPGRLEGGRAGDRRVDPHGATGLAFEVIDQRVERPVRSFPQVIVVAGKQRDAHRVRPAGN